MRAYIRFPFAINPTGVQLCYWDTDSYPPDSPGFDLHWIFVQNRESGYRAGFECFWARVQDRELVAREIELIDTRAS